MPTAGPVAPVRPAGLRKRWLFAGLGAVLVALVAGVSLGPVSLPPGSVAAELLNLLPGVHLDSGLTEREIAIVTELRLPRVVLGLLVGALLALAGGCYQGVFRNPLADPYLLGVAAGAGLAVTTVIALGVGSGGALSGMPLTIPLAAFVGSLGAVAMTYLLGAAGGRHRSPATLILAGVAVSAFLSAGQTYLLQRHSESIQQVYSWLLGRLATAGWQEVRLVLPYFVLTAVVVLLHRRELDVLSVGDDEATSLGLHPQRSRYLLIAAASLGTAAAVSASGLIGFVGIIVPHTVRLLAGSSYRVILPLSMLFGGAFLALTDVAARTVAAPAELPIGVVTALLGGPFFVLVLRTSRRVFT
ncbi:iron ABC transporter permease [Micromonospora sp. DR5-3]|uniref:FecCD family ABC transporter permease n=1 Tax=unclassified Micromonospora TaxID=2617518 RepID=UPI0011D51579|nr:MULTISPECIES: iron ABC transporter permease [unclassified Micromonospora]MCW3820227.1 iron ABC transporter permease [Micromonospora sp. DR5-3]TYC19690.1 iron ABC transporter permease [Micromonospora sp. MP36]